MPRTALDAALKAHAGLVRRIALHMIARMSANVELDDLLQAGMIGLANALQRFDASQGVQFETFATPRIRGAMLDELRGNDWMSREQRRLARQVEAAAEQLRHRLGREPRPAEVAEAAGLAVDDYWQAQTAAASGPVPLDDGADDWAAPDDPARQIDAARLDAWIAAAIDALPERERLVMRNALDGSLQQQEMAAQLGVAPCRVSGLYQQAVARVRRAVLARVGPRLRETC